MKNTDFDTDVVVVGCGPTGATLANLLALGGVRVLILEREDEIYPLPRAVHFDDEIMRVFQTIGISEKLKEMVQINSGMRFVDKENNILLDWPRPKEIGRHGWYPSYRFHQPDLETLLREKLHTIDTVDMKFGTEVLSVTSNKLYTEVFFKDRNSGLSTSVRSKYVVGCDGANSIIRSVIGEEKYDCGFQERWLVADVLLKEELPELGDRTIQHCSNTRPITYCGQPKNRRRWEIRLLDEESELEFTKPSKVWSILKKWINPKVAELERTAVYTFRSMVSKKWMKGRLFIAGDAAHLMPPFMGQGMCAGIRDVANLAWKLVAEIKNQAEAGLLDTYESERVPHVQKYIDTAIKLGGLINATDPTNAFESSKKNTKNGTTMKSLYPELGIGLGSFLGSNLKKHRGLIASQPRLSKNQLMDDLSGYKSVFISRSPIKRLLDNISELPFLCIDTIAEPRLNQFLDDLDVEAALIRPDRYILGTAKSFDEQEALISIRY